MMLPDETESALPAQIKSEAEKRTEELMELLPEMFTTSEAITKGSTIGMEKRTVEDHLRDLCESKSIVRISRGKYKKV